MQDAKRFSCVLCRRRKLKCDGARPKCMTCTRLRHQCEYVEPQKRAPHRRRNMKDLETRLKQVEGLLASQNTSLASSCEVPPLASDLDQNSMTDIDLQQILSGMEQATSNNIFNSADLDILSNNTNSPSSILYAPVKDVVPLGLEESLPSQEIIDELHEIYFDKINANIPIFHKSRYLSAMKLPSYRVPAVCLRYAVWALAASVSERHGQYETTFYERARKYAQIDEMKDMGQSLLTLDHIRFWILTSDYESRKMFFHRSWSSGGRAVRLAQMSGLHRLDDVNETFSQKLSPNEFTDLEERRRIFWAAFCSDRYSCIVTGWPLAIDEKDITTNLPASEEAFEKGEGPATVSLSAALDNDIISDISSWGGVVIMAALFGRIVIHLHQPVPGNGFQDLSRGEFWKRHRKMEGMFSNMVMLLPNHLRFTSAMMDCHLFILNLSMHALIVALHQAAVTKAEMYGLDPSLVRHSQAKSDAAAEEMVRVMRLASNTMIENMHPFVSFCLHMAASSFVRSSKDSMHEYQSQRNLEILLVVVRALKRKLPTLYYVTEKIKDGLQNVERDKSLSLSQIYVKPQIDDPRHASSAIQSPKYHCEEGTWSNSDSSMETSDLVSSVAGRGNLRNVELATRELSLSGKTGLSHASTLPNEPYPTNHDIVRPQREQMISGSYPDTFRAHDVEDSSFAQYGSSQQVQQEQSFQSQQLDQNGILYAVPHGSTIRNSFTSKMTQNIPDTNLQANPDPTITLGYNLNFSQGEIMPSIFEELLTWEGDDMMPP